MSLHSIHPGCREVLLCPRAGAIVTLSAPRGRLVTPRDTMRQRDADTKHGLLGRSRPCQPAPSWRVTPHGLCLVKPQRSLSAPAMPIVSPHGAKRMGGAGPLSQARGGGVH